MEFTMVSDDDGSCMLSRNSLDDWPGGVGQ